MQQSSIIRQDAWQAQFSKDYGNALYFPKRQMFYLLLISFVTLICFLVFICTVRLAKTQPVIGWISTDTVYTVSSQHNNMQVSDIYVKPNEKIKKGQRLIKLTRDTSSAHYHSLNEQRLHIENQSSTAQLQIKKSTNKAALQFHQRALVNLQHQQQNLEARTALQTKRLNAKKNQSEIVSGLAQQHAISQYDALQREDDLDKEYLQLKRLEQQSLTLELEIAEAHSKRERLLDELEHSISNEENQQQLHLNQLESLANEHAYFINAPADGVISDIGVSVGQLAHFDQTLLKLKSPLANTKAFLAIPTNAVGMSLENKNTFIKVDAFPVQQFGGLQGQISSISQTPILPRKNPNIPAKIDFPFYLGEVNLPTNYLYDGNKQHRIRHGMLVQADIINTRQTLLEWIIAPFTKARSRS